MVATPDDVRSEGNIPDVSDEVINPQLVKAEVELKRILTSAVYDAISQEQSPYNSNDKARLVSAESLFALFYLIPVINTVTSGEGGITRSIGYGGTQTNYLDQEEAGGLASMYYKRGLALIDEYIPVTADGDMVVGRDLSLYAV